MLALPLTNAWQHWIQDCPQRLQTSHSKPPSGYTCNICQSVRLRRLQLLADEYEARPLHPRLPEQGVQRSRPKRWRPETTASRLRVQSMRDAGRTLCPRMSRRSGARSREGEEEGAGTCRMCVSSHLKCHTEYRRLVLLE